MRYRTFAALLAVAMVVFAGIAACSKTESPPPMPAMEQGAQADFAQKADVMGRAERVNAGEAMQLAEPEMAPSEDKQAGISLAALADSQPDRYLIKDAVLAIEVDDARAGSDALVAIVKGAGGYVGQLLEQVNSLGIRSVSMEVRVPAGRFEDSMRQFDPLGKVIQKQITTRDVTEEYVDTDAKVRNLKRTEERVLDHLNRTAKLEDILQVEQELSRYRERIEQMEGRLRFLQNRVAFSTIQVRLEEKPKASTLVPPQSFSTAEVFSRATRSLVSFSQTLWVKVIWLLVWTPVWVPLLVIAYVVYRRAIKPALKQSAPKSE